MGIFSRENVAGTLLLRRIYHGWQIVVVHALFWRTETIVVLGSFVLTVKYISPWSYCYILKHAWRNMRVLILWGAQMAYHLSALLTRVQILPWRRTHIMLILPPTIYFHGRYRLKGHWRIIWASFVHILHLSHWINIIRNLCNVSS